MSASIHNIEPGLMILVFIAATVLVICITLTIQLVMKGHSNSPALWIAWGINAIIVWALVVNARESTKRVTLITFYPNKMQIVRSSIWYSDVHPEDITKMEIIPAGKNPERYMIQTDKKSFCISSDNMRNYPELIQHIREFA
ncbi:hypothetical protein [uncultured Desulfobulbus sp.]|uniref:hypothetical protein n=1 Tax=uncultured Desulfobulbus sp. TaxID=239745 RepID=UPI0029C727EB|nr:hypothetical protein [uncultured Desulfobulbus sp.]